MTEEDAERAKAQAREFPESIAILDRIRVALVNRMFKTAINATEEREGIFLRVQTIDAMRGEMERLLADHASEKQIQEYVESLKTPATTGS